MGQQAGSAKLGFAGDSCRLSNDLYTKTYSRETL
jgi:hypothetical protein